VSNPSVTVDLPSPEEASSLVTALGAIVGVVGGVWALVVRVLRRRRRRQLVQELEGRALRYLIDAQRHTLHTIVPGEEARYVDLTELNRQKVLIDQVRDQLWVADGHESQRESERQANDLLKVLTRTQAIRMKQQRQDMFKEDDL
jgi:hypothetical protein